ncbi:MAG: response regulator [Planctomycetota bacterium]
MDNSPRILVVDDSPEVRDVIAQALALRSIPTTVVCGGPEALEQLAEQSFDLVLTDLIMPQIGGLDLLRELTRSGSEAVPVIITGKGTIQDAVELMKEGAFDILVKPFKLEELFRVVEKALQHRRLQREKRDLERRLGQSEKMAVVGRLAAGVAHELNNPLDGVLRFVNLSLEALQGDYLDERQLTSVRENLGDAKNGLRRMADIVRSLLRFSRNVVVENEPKNLIGLLRDAVYQTSSGLDRVLPRVEIDVPQEDLQVPGGLFQVFTNLVKNAYDALGESGSIRIHAHADPDRVEIVFADDGPGIPRELRDMIFEPFFTTKEVGKGTGLGLPICARILESFDGAIEVEDNDGGGTLFRLTLPREATVSSSENPLEAASRPS